MSTRADHFVRALDYAALLRCRRLVAWTGSHTAALMKPDPRNDTRESEDRIVRFLEPHLPALEQRKLTLALETYITLTCPDAPSLSRLLRRLPKTVGAVMDPPNLTPVRSFSHRDDAMRVMFRHLRSRVAVVHLKDFRLKPGGGEYELPGPLEGEMNYRLYAELINSLPADTPLIAEHIAPAEFRAARRKLAALFR
jgi:sugar phosphate isomerase/epimerase